MQRELGCHSLALHPIRLNGVRDEFDRCPLALIREMPAGDAAWASWGQRWFFAGEQGYLGAMLSNPSNLALEVLAIAGQYVTEARAEDVANAAPLLPARRA